MLKQTPPARLVEAIRQIARGGAVGSPEVAIRVVELFRKVPPRESGSAGLSPQEMAEMMEATGSLPHPCGGLVAGSSADVFFPGAPRCRGVGLPHPPPAWRMTGRRSPPRAIVPRPPDRRRL